MKYNVPDQPGQRLTKTMNILEQSATPNLPHLMNCSHSEEGWCLQCVNNLHIEAEIAKVESVDLRRAVLRLAEDWEREDVGWQKVTGDNGDATWLAVCARQLRAEIGKSQNGQAHLRQPDHDSQKETK